MKISRIIIAILIEVFIIFVVMYVGTLAAFMWRFQLDKQYVDLNDIAKTTGVISPELYDIRNKIEFIRSSTFQLLLAMAGGIIGIPCVTWLIKKK